MPSIDAISNVFLLTVLATLILLSIYVFWQHQKKITNTYNIASPDGLPCARGYRNTGGVCEAICPPPYYKLSDDGKGCVSAAQNGAILDPRTLTYTTMCPAGTTYMSTDTGDYCQSICTDDKTLIDGKCEPKCKTADRVWNPVLQKCVCDATKGLRETTTGECVYAGEVCPIGNCKRVNYNGVDVCLHDGVQYFCHLSPDEYNVTMPYADNPLGEIRTKQDSKCEPPGELWSNTICYINHPVGTLDNGVPYLLLRIDKK